MAYARDPANKRQREAQCSIGGFLREEGFRPFLDQRVPPNDDGGIVLGQIWAAARAKLHESRG